MNFLIVDDHEIVRSGIRNVLGVIYKPDNIFDAIDEESAMLVYVERAYDLVIMDVQLSKTDTIRLIEFMLMKNSETKLLMFSMTPEKIYASKFYNAGAMGFVSKSAGLDELTKAIDLVLNGRKYYSRSYTDQQSLYSKNHNFTNPFELLSSREMEVAMLLLKGSTIVTISDQLAINPSTVASHKAHIYQKLGVDTSGELIAIGRLNNIIAH